MSYPQLNKKYNFITKVLFDAEISACNISLDLEYAVDCTVTCVDDDDTLEVEINRMAVQSGVYDDGEVVSMSPWMRVDMNTVSPKTYNDIVYEVKIKFSDAFDDGELHNDEFPVLPVMVVSEYAANQ